MWQGENLIHVNASAPNKYVTCLMEKLFTHEERLNGYIVEGASTTERNHLDNEKIAILKLAVINKYKAVANDVDQFWKAMKRTANRKCLDTKPKTSSN